jgi:WD40 repeat protein
VLQNFVGSALPIYSVVFTVDGNTVLGGSHLFHINSWKIQDGQRNPGWALASSNTKAVFSPNSDFVVIQALDNSLNVWEVNTGQLLHSFVGHTNWVKDWFFSLDGTMVISTSEDKTIKCWDVQSGKLINSIEGLVEVRLIPFSDAKRIVCVNSSESTVIRDLETGQILGSYEGLATHVTADGKLFVNRNLLSYSRGTLVDLITGEVRSLQGGILFQHAVTDDLASIGHEDRFIKRWDLQVGEVQALFANSGGVKHLKVSKDGHWLVCSNGLEVFIFEWIK